MEPANNTVVRFVTAYDHGFSFPFKRLILGYGYIEEGGISHKQLIEVYLGTEVVHSAKETVYPGYLYVIGDRVRVFATGGSQTLGIDGSLEKRNNFIRELESLQDMKTAIINLYPLITSGKVQHVMLAP